MYLTIAVTLSSADNCLGLDWWRTGRPTGYCLGNDECHCANIWWNVQSIDEMFNDGDCNNTMCFICDGMDIMCFV